MHIATWLREIKTFPADDHVVRDLMLRLVFASTAFSIHAVTCELINLFSKKIIPINFMHNSIPVTGYRIDDFAYLTDIKTIKEKELKKLKKLDVLVISSLRKKEHPNHMNLEESISLIKKINPNKAYLTHISHLMGFHEEVSKTLPKNIFLAYDNLKIKSN